MNTIDKIMVGLAKLFGVALMGAAVCAWGYQLYFYLQHGSWVSFDVIAAIAKFGDMNISRWAQEPAQWIGLHKLLTFVPVSALAFFAGAAIFESVDT